jgi:hypothetical protein
MSSNTRQTTMAKLARERRVKEKRALKQEKKEARKQAAAEAAEGSPPDDAVEERPES